MTLEEKKGLEPNWGPSQAPTFAMSGESLRPSELSFLACEEKIVISILLTSRDRSEGSETRRLQLCGSERALTQLGARTAREGRSGAFWAGKGLPVREQRWPRLGGRKEHSVSGERGLT